MDENITTIGEEVEAIILSFIRCILSGGAGCYLTYFGVCCIFDFILKGPNGWEPILSLIIGIPVSLIGILLFFLNLYLLLGVCRYCSDFAKIKITV